MRNVVTAPAGFRFPNTRAACLSSRSRQVGTGSALEVASAGCAPWPIPPHFSFYHGARKAGPAPATWPRRKRTQRFGGGYASAQASILNGEWKTGTMTVNLLPNLGAPMAGRIFVSYRRDDAPGDARGVRDGLAAKFGRANVFMDVDNLLAGQRFDEELSKALAACDLFVAIIGSRWMDLLKTKIASGERDYVREEIAGALQRKIVVIPVRVGREGQMPSLPRANELPDDIRDLVLYQKHDVAHERFGRDIAELVKAITIVRRSQRPERSALALRWALVGAAMASIVASVLAFGPVTTALFSTSDQAKRKTEEERLRQTHEDRQREATPAKRKSEEQAARAAPVPGQTFRDCYSDDPVRNRACPEMVVVPAGAFTMGSNEYNEKPPHTLTIRQSFAVGKFEVTFDEWAACVEGGGCQSNRNPSDHGWGKNRRPVINVSWNDAQNYVAWLSKKTGKRYRLLTEAEWEYAARGGTTARYSWGDDVGSGNANCDGCKSQSGGKHTVPVGAFKPNAFGLHDMHGNVSEWVEDCWHDNYNDAPSDGSAWGWACTDGRHRVVRGGSWSGSPWLIRAAVRDKYTTDYRDNDLGFRVARTLSP